MSQSLWHVLSYPFLPSTWTTATCLTLTRIKSLTCSCYHNAHSHCQSLSSDELLTRRQDCTASSPAKRRGIMRESERRGRTGKQWREEDVGFPWEWRGLKKKITKGNIFNRNQSCLKGHSAKNEVPFFKCHQMTLSTFHISVSPETPDWLERCKM